VGNVSHQLSLLAVGAFVDLRRHAITAIFYGFPSYQRCGQLCSTTGRLGLTEVPAIEHPAWLVINLHCRTPDLRLCPGHYLGGRPDSCVVPGRHSTGPSCSVGVELDARMTCRVRAREREKRDRLKGSGSVVRPSTLNIHHSKFNILPTALTFTLTPHALRSFCGFRFGGWGLKGCFQAVYPFSNVRTACGVQKP